MLVPLQIWTSPYRKTYAIVGQLGTWCTAHLISYLHICRSLEGHEASVVAVAFSPDSSYIVSGSNNGDLRIWDAKYGHGKHLIMELDAHDLGVCGVEFSPTYGSASKFSSSSSSSSSSSIPPTRPPFSCKLIESWAALEITLSLYLFWISKL